uniref:CCAAT/enhancer-binding protein zeta n=1 Tax=Cyprinodon variegatus TaxID=28743 RepID=A0A3Q2DA84_CYPVA
MADERSSDESQQEENSEPEEAAGGEEFRLEEVLRLGGTQADYVLLAALDDSAELVDGGMKGAIDDLEEGELEKFITKLGIRGHAGLSVPDDQEGGGAAQQEKNSKKVTATPAADQESAAKIKKQKKKEDGQLPAGKKSKQNLNVFEFQPRQVLLIKPGGKWFELEYASEGSEAPQDGALVSRYKALAQQLFESEVQLYRTKKNLQKGANSTWIKTVVSSGVLADRMAAMTLLIQDAPVHMLDHVETLVSMVKKKGSRRMGLMALDTMRELLLSNLLPEDRKLRPFAQHPFDQLEERASGNRDARDRRLILWYFEHQLKHHVAEFVAALDVVAHDTVAATKAKALAAAHELLLGRPEQERALLSQLVNKLGDPDYKMAAKAAHLLETLLHRHPNMKAVVCCEVERLMFRPNIGAKAQYYAVCFLSQVALNHEEAPLASKLIAVYFSFFRACVKKKDVESKMLSALLSGVNRAYPYAAAGDEKVKEQLDTLFRVVHLAKFNTAVQALMLLFQVLDSQQSVSDRFYVALYRKLLDPGLSGSSRQNMFLNLLYKALKADVAPRRVKAFIKRLLQVGAEQGASFACGALFLVSEVMKAKPGLRVLLDQGENGAEEEEEFRDLKEDDEDEEERIVEEGVCEAEPQNRPASSWVHHQNLEGRSSEGYDPLHRNPLFCGADRSTLWELHRLALHFHPSVSLFARTILQGEPVQYSGDPLQDFTLIRFLDRFVFRNPKQLKGKRKNRPDPIRLRRHTRLNRNVKSKKGKKEQEDSEDSDVDDLDDEEVSLGSMDEEDFGDDLEEEGGTFMDPDDDDDDGRVSYWSDLTTRSGSFPPRLSPGSSSFSSGAGFGSLLDENSDSKFDNIGLNAMANTDRAGLKQLKWEAQRDDWVHGRDAKTLRRKKSSFNKRRPLGRTRPAGGTFRKKKKK